MEIRQLRFAVTLARTLNFRRAAEVEFIRQSSLSESIRRLEAEVGVPLFIRNTRGVQLTEAGAVFVERAEGMLAKLAELQVEVQDIHRGSRGELRIGVFAEGLAELTPLVIRSFRSASPKVKLVFVELSIDDQVSALVDELVDVAIVRPPFNDRRLVVDELFQEPRIALVAASHPLAEAGVASFHDLVDDPVLSTDRPSWGSFWSYDEVRGASGRAVATVHTIAESLTAVAYLGATDTVPSSAARFYRHPGVKQLRITDGDLVSVGLARRASDQRFLTRAFCLTAAHVSERQLSLVPEALQPAAAPAERRGL